MKLYLACTAPGTEGKDRILSIRHRLLSYSHVIGEKFDVHIIFRKLIELKQGKGK